MAAMMGKEWGGMGQNYLRSLLALGFQAFLIIVCVAIYAVLVPVSYTHLAIRFKKPREQFAAAHRDELDAYNAAIRYRCV